MSEENQRVTIEGLGEVDKSVADYIESQKRAAQDGAQKNATERMKAQIGTALKDSGLIEDDFDFTKFSTKDIAEIIATKIPELKKAAQRPPQNADDKTAAEIEARIKGQYETEFKKRERELLHSVAVRSAQDRIMADAVSKNLAENMRDASIFNALVSKHFEIVIDGSGTTYRDKEKQTDIIDESGKPAGSGEIVKRIQELYPQIFEKPRAGISLSGAQSDGAARSPKDIPTIDLLKTSLH